MIKTSSRIIFRDEQGQSIGGIRVTDMEDGDVRITIMSPNLTASVDLSSDDAATLNYQLSAIFEDRQSLKLAYEHFKHEQYVSGCPTCVR